MSSTKTCLSTKDVFKHGGKNKYMGRYLAATTKSATPNVCVCVSVRWWGDDVIKRHLDIFLVVEALILPCVKCAPPLCTFISRDYTDILNKDSSSIKCFSTLHLSGYASLSVWSQRSHRPALFFTEQFFEKTLHHHLLAPIGFHSNWWVSKYDVSKHTVANQILTLYLKQPGGATSWPKSDPATSLNRY